MKEIELKFRVKNLAELENNLLNNGCKLGEIINQNDTIYIEDLNHTESIEGSVWLRVRKENNKIELNYKKQSNILQKSREIEFGVDSYEKAKEFVEALGYKKWVTVNKKRRLAKYLNYNLCIDEVERLGNFIEIEILVDEDDNNEYLEKIKDVAKLFSLTENDIINSHYDTMISELDLEK